MGYLQVKGLFVAMGMVMLTGFGLAIGCLILHKRKYVTLLDPNKKYKLRLIYKSVINHNTRRMRFALPTVFHTLGLPAGKHVYILAKINGSLVVRPYTPVSTDDERGYVDLVIKIYFRGQHPTFPEGGKMSQYLDNLSIGDVIEFQGPRGLLAYNGKGEFGIQINKKSPVEKKFARQVGMIAGGTGITPMLQLIQTILKDPDDLTKCSLLFANKSKNDIILREELQELERKHSGRFKVWFAVETAPEGWEYSEGLINCAMIRAHLPSPADDVFILLCGPPAMIQLACKPNLSLLGYQEDSCFVY
ncbi:hypothetical protein XENTR_v10005723 [Xenopus tropicalis]|nr:hypothetical protein XENTR_v10005723 [Xenopus tropicalis]